MKLMLQLMKAINKIVSLKTGYQAFFFAIVDAIHLQCLLNYQMLLMSKRAVNST